MGSTSGIFIIVTILVSGFVAWAGDTLGRVLGKRRIALFGMRPRRTSLLIAVFTGMIITALTITALAVASDNVREMLFRMDELKSELDDKRVAVDAMAGIIEEGQATIQLQQDAINTGIEQINDLSFQLSTYEEDVEALEVKIGALSDEINSLEIEKDDLIEENETLIAGHEESKAEFESEIATLNTEIADREARVADLNQQIESKNDLIESLGLLVEELDREIAVRTLGDIKVFEGQQLGVVLIDTNLDQATIYDLLRGWLSTIPMTYMDAESGQLVLSENLIEATSEEFYNAMQEIRDTSSEKAVVIALSMENVVDDQPVPVRFEVSRHRQLYSSGTRIYSNTYEEPIGAIDPYRAVSARFFEDARDYLINDRGLVPSTANEIMQFTIDDLLNLSQELSDTGFPVILRMVALTDIYVTDFLVYGEQFTITIETAVESDPD